MNLRAVIAANGVPAPTMDLPALIRPDDLLIAADGGARLFQAARIAPHFVIGDFDSLRPDEQAALDAQGAQLVRHPVRKDRTDLELAVRLAIEQGASEVLIVAALGGRWDQTLANLLLAAQPAFAAINLRLIDGQQEILLLRPDQTYHLPGQAGDTLSLIPVGGDAHGVTATGLEWPLDDDTLYLGATRGVSNVLTAPTAAISLRTGLVACIVVHQDSGGRNP